MMAGASWRVVVCAGALAAGVAAGPHGPVAVVAAALVAAVTVLAVFDDRRRLTVAVAVAACAVGAWRGAAAAAVERGPGAVAGHLGAGPVVIRGTVGDAGVPGRDDTFVLDVSTLATRQGTWSVRGAVVVEPRAAVSVLPGDLLDVSAAALDPPHLRPGALSAAALDRAGVEAIAPAAQVTILAVGSPTPSRLLEVLRRGLAATVGRALPEPEASLLLGIAFGVHAHIAGDVRAALQDSGLVHAIAVSGLKVAMVAGMLDALLGALGWPRRRRGPPVITVTAAYIALSGGGAAAVRSGLMVAAGLLFARDGRRPHGFALLAVCAALLLLLEPALATDVGFQLSFLGTAGILALAGPIATWLPGPRPLIEPAAVTIAAQLATAPVTAGVFGVLSLVGPLANALALPLLPPAIVTGTAGAIAALVLPAASWVPLHAAGALCTAVLAVARGTAALPLAAITVPAWPPGWTAVEAAAVMAGVLAWRVVVRLRPATLGVRTAVVGAASAAGAVTAMVVGVLGSGQPLRLTVLDVGNATAVLVRPSGGGAILVDGGSDGTALLTALGRTLSPFERHLDAVVLTAADRASSAALAELVGRYDVGTLVVEQALPPALGTIAVRLAGTGTQVVDPGGVPWRLGTALVRCLPAGPPGAPCAVEVTDGAATALVLGDMTSAAQDELAGIGGPRLRSALVVAPSTTAPSPALLATAQPDVAAIPAARAPAGLSATGMAAAVTGHDGDLTYSAAGATFLAPGS